MLSRTLTLAGQPNIQIILYFESRSNAEKAGEYISKEKNDDGSIACSYRFEDDFKQRVDIGVGAVILSDLITDINQMFEVSGELEVAKMKGAKHLENRVAADPLLKVWLEQKHRENSQRQRSSVMMAPPLAG